ncbi:CNNM domain-containing protein, partial [Rickettsiales bacterium]|nr:CNNM domain-containing protein [Rickettsiales bacterium]
MIVISAFFSGVETGITASSKGKIHRMSLDGNKSAKMIEFLLKDKDNLIATILLGNNIVNILASAIATSLFINHFGAVGVLYATIMMTIALLIFSEITPKTYALKNPEKVALFTVWPLAIFVKIFYPITKIINVMVSLLTRSAIKSGKNITISSFDEIRGTVALKHKEGSIVKYDKDMISGILDLSQVSIADVIIHRKNIKSINIDQDISDIIKQAFKINHTKIPLWRSNRDNIVSILNIKQLIKVLNQSNNDFTKVKLSSITFKPWFVPVTNNLRDQLINFKKKERKFAVAVDEYGDLEGVITLEDILEEIVGNINEREIRKRVKIINLKEGYWQSPGDFPIRDLNRKLNWNLPDDDDRFSTIAGF